MNKQIDEGKKLADRLKQKDKQLTKEVTQADLEMVQFQRVKQAALNEINVTIPLKLSQIYAFEGSGALTNPREYTTSHSPETSQHEHNYSQSVVSVPAFAPLMATPVPDEAALEEINVLQSADERVLSSQLTMQSHIVIDIRCVAHHLYTVITLFIQTILFAYTVHWRLSISASKSSTMTARQLITTSYNIVKRKLSLFAIRGNVAKRSHHGKQSVKSYKCLNLVKL